MVTLPSLGSQLGRGGGGVALTWAAGPRWEWAEPAAVTGCTDRVAAAP